MKKRKLLASIGVLLISAACSFGQVWHTNYVTNITTTTQSDGRMTYTHSVTNLTVSNIVANYDVYHGSALPSAVGVTNTIVVTTTNDFTTPILGTNPPASILAILQSYLTDNDPTCHIWETNHVDLFQAAVFQNVTGVNGSSAVGNVLGLEVPVYRFSSNQFGFHVESVTDFEQVFGDLGWQAIGVGFDYNIHQVQMALVLDGDISLKGPTTFHVAPYLEFKKASTTLASLSPIFRVGVEIEKKAGLQAWVGLQIAF